MVCLSDIWAWTRTRKCPQERQMIFSHGQFCMTPLRRKKVLEQTVYCTLSQVMCSVNDITLCYGTGCCSMCGTHCESPRKPSGCRNPPYYYFQLIFLNSKQSAYTSYNYTSCRSKSGVIWGRSVVMHVRCMVFSVALPSLGPLEGSLWNGSTWPWPMTVTYCREAVNLWHTAVTNCEEKVREICSGAILKDMALSACLPWVWLSKNEILESWILWRGAAIYCSLLVFMEVILVVSGSELMF